MATKVNALQFIGASPTKAGVSIWNQCQCCLGLRACRHTFSHSLKCRQFRDFSLHGLVVIMVVHRIQQSLVYFCSPFTVSFVAL